MKKKSILTEEEVDKRVKEARNQISYFIYSEDRKTLYFMAIGIEELSKFLNRRKSNVENDLKKISRKRKEENKLIKNQQGLKFVILTQKEMAKRL